MLLQPATIFDSAKDEGWRVVDILALAGTLLLVAVALYYRQIFGGQTFVWRDHLVYTWPSRQLLFEAMRSHALREWNDLIGLGTQFAASSANGVAYPPLWLVALPLPLGMDLTIVVHVVLAGAGTSLFARRLGASKLGGLFAGAALMSCGYVASIAPNKVFISAAWLPLVAWAADRVAVSEAGRRRVFDALVLAAIVAFQLLGGDPAASIATGLVVLGVILARSTQRPAALLWTAVAYALAVLLAAVGVLPSLALLPHTKPHGAELRGGHHLVVAPVAPC